MKKIIFTGLFFWALNSFSFATAPTDGNFPKGVNNASAVWFNSITDNNATHQRCRAVWVGTTQALDFSPDGTTWVLFQNATAGTIIDIQAVGARKDAAGAAPSAGDVVFLY